MLNRKETFNCKNIHCIIFLSQTVMTKKRIIFNWINEINMKYIDTDSLNPEHTLTVLELAIAIVYTL